MTPVAVFGGAGRRRRRARVLAIVITASALGAGCATRGFRPPDGPGAPAPEAAAALDEATARCRNASSFEGRPSLSGRAGADAIPSIRIDTVLTRAGGIYLEANAGPMGAVDVFWLSGRDGRATLLLEEDNAFVDDQPAAIVEALTAVSLGPDRLLAMLTGCISRDLAVSDAAAYEGGDLIRVTTADATLYLRRTAGRWRVQAGAFDGLTVELVEHGPAFPADLRIVTGAGAETPVDLRVRVSPPIRVNGTVNPAAFERTPPAGAARITLADLRAAGPLRSRDGGG